MQFLKFSVQTFVIFSLLASPKMKLSVRYLLLMALLFLASLVYDVIDLGVPVNEIFPHLTGSRRKEKTLLYKSEECNCSRIISVPSVFTKKQYNQSDTMSWCSHESLMRGYNQSVVGYALYGSALKNGKLGKYFSLLNILPAQIRQYYPGWRMRIYHDFRPDELELSVLCDAYCYNDNVDLCNVNQMVDIVEGLRMMKAVLPFTENNLMDLNPMKWRYLPLLDPYVDRFIARDLDAEIIPREKSAVDQWLQSNRTFHVMRDHQGHGDPIMGGMFGAKVHQRRGIIRVLMKALIMLGNKVGYGHDQDLLGKVFWPIVKDDAVIHDSYFCNRDWNSLPFTPFPTQRVNLTFVSFNGALDWPPVSKCPVACRPPNHLDWEYC